MRGQLQISNQVTKKTRIKEKAPTATLSRWACTKRPPFSFPVSFLFFFFAHCHLSYLLFVQAGRSVLLATSRGEGRRNELNNLLSPYLLKNGGRGEKVRAISAAARRRDPRKPLFVITFVFPFASRKVPCYEDAVVLSLLSLFLSRFSFASWQSLFRQIRVLHYLRKDVVKFFR